MFLLLFALSVGLLWLYLRRHVNYWKNRGIAHARPGLLVGNVWPLIRLRSSPGMWLQKLYDHPLAKDEPFFGFHIFDKPALLIRDPELIKQIFIKDFNYFSDRFSFSSPHYDPLAGKNLFFKRGKLWRALRVTLTPTFTSKRMREMHPLVLMCVKELIEHLKKMDKKIAQEIREPTARCATDIILSCAFGIDGNCLKNDDSEFRMIGRGIFEFSPLNAIKIFSVFFAPHYIPSLLKVAFFNKYATMFFRKIFWEVMDSREKSATKRNDLIELLIELQQKGYISSASINKNEAKLLNLDRDDIVAQAAVYFAAGFETTTSTITFAFHELARAPEVQERARKEVLKVLEKHGEINYDALGNMIYLEQVINETLRMYPPLPFLDREVNQDYQIPGSKVILEKGTPIYIGLEGLHRDPKYYPDPEKFDPDRFSEEAKKNRPTFTHLPFGEGPRNCIGSRFGMMVTKTIIAHVLANLELEPDRTRPIGPPERNTMTMMTQAKDGIHLELRNIKSTLA